MEDEINNPNNNNNEEFVACCCCVNSIAVRVPRVSHVCISIMYLCIKNMGQFLRKLPHG